MTKAFWYDGKQAEKEIAEWYQDDGEKIHAALPPIETWNTWLLLRWPLIEATAVAILLHADRKGVVNRVILGELEDVIKDRMSKKPLNPTKRTGGYVELRCSLGQDVMAIWRAANPNVTQEAWEALPTEVRQIIA